MSLPRWLKSYKLNAPLILDTFMRENLAESNPRDLWLFPYVFPVFIANPSGNTPIINWYDRNSKTTIMNYSGQNIPPHAAATRWVYTVPAKRKAFVELVELKIMRWTAASAAAWAFAALHYIPSGGVDSPLFDAWLMDTAVGVRENITVGQSMLMFEGDQIYATTGDVSPDGSIFYFITAKITEFDA